MTDGNGRAIATSIRDDEAYSGVRVAVAGALSVARILSHVDINVGDPVWPDPEEVTLPRLLGGNLVVTGYPLSMVYAEKLVTMLQRRSENSRWRDFADVYLLSGRQDIDGHMLCASIQTVVEHRRVDLLSLSKALAGFSALAQTRWAGWRRRHQLKSELPVDFDEILTRIFEFADPAITGGAIPMTWDSAALRWYGARERSDADCQPADPSS